tara:strand:- start:199 stop:453 length:255 start_codon:yes stop_codon:yes gene_type:complete
MARKCGTCGESGHTTRNCPDNEAERYEKQRQKSLPKPTVIHMSGTWDYNGGKYKCGAKSEEWPEKYMDDSFARTLPICPACQNA